MTSRRWARDSELTSNQTGKVDPAYMAEVERMTHRREVDWERQIRGALQAVEKAERAAEHQAKVAAAAQTKRAREAATRRTKVLWELVELRRAELESLRRMMQQAPASASHRGTSSYTKVPHVHGNVG